MTWVLIIILIIGEALYRWGVKVEFTRKVVHTLAGTVLVLAPWLWTREFALGVGVAFVCLFLIVEKYKFLPSITSISRNTFGGVFFPLGVTLAVIIGWNRPASFQLAVLTLALADTLAWVAGRGYAGLDLPKKWPVSIAFGLVCLAIWLIIGWPTGLITSQYLLAALFFSSVLSVVERFSTSGADNLFIPVLASLFGLIVF